MAYGVIMGQTPILNASGITYDNSQTSSIITANNVQQAIDESAKKIESVQSSGVQWELIYKKDFNTSIYKSNQLVLETNLDNKLLGSYGFLASDISFSLLREPSILQDIHIYIDKIQVAGIENVNNYIGENFSFSSSFLKAGIPRNNFPENRFFVAGFTFNGLSEGTVSNMDLYMSPSVPAPEGYSDNVDCNGTYKIYGLKAPI